MRKSIIALVVVSSFASVAANAASNAADFAAAFQQFEHGATFFNEAPLDSTPSNQLNDAYNEAKAGLARMGVKSGDYDDVIANYKNYVSSETISSWVGYDLYGAKPVETVAMSTLTPATAPDKTTHLDSNSTAEQQQAAKAAAEKQHGDDLTKANNMRTRQQVLAGGESEVNAEIQAENTAKQQNAEMQQANRERAASQHVTPTVENGVNGKDGVNGSNGKDGITTVKTVNVVDNAAHEQINANKSRIETNSRDIVANHNGVIANSNAIHHNSAAIERNSQRIDKNSKDIAENRKAIKRVGAMAQASSNLHYNRNENGYAVSVGEYAGATAVAGGVQFKTSETTAITIQASYDGENAGGSVGFHGNW